MTFLYKNIYTSLTFISNFFPLMKETQGETVRTRKLQGTYSLQKRKPKKGDTKHMTNTTPL